MRYGINTEHSLTLSEVSQKLGISRERVRQIEERAVRTVRKKAQELGLLEKQDKDFATQKLHPGMHLKAKTNILGDVVGKDKISKLAKERAKAKEAAKAELKNKTKTKKQTAKKPAKKAVAKVAKKIKKDKRK